MKKQSSTFKVGSRASNLALIQTRQAVDRLGRLFPHWTFEVLPASSPGDRDRELDLRESPADFFTRDLDEAILRGDLDCAVHSAKDMPDPVAPGLDWFWLPWREDPRDSWVIAGKSLADLPPRPRIGVSSERRATYARRRLPDAQILPIRGNIEERIAQLDAGRFDAIIVAGAALIRLGLESRIADWISAAELLPPPGQGVLGISFRSGDPCWVRLRSLFVRPAVFVGAGAGRAGMCTAEGLEELKTCDVCLHDALMDSSLLAHLPPHAERVDAGKRAGESSHPQTDTTELILRYARRGRRVVRLKGGDAGIFGRLAEETEALESLGLPFRVVPGVSSLNMATTGTGMLLTRRGVSGGFCAITARSAGGKPADVSAAARSRLPVVFFMAGSASASVRDQLLRDGWSAETPATVVFAAGSDEETISDGALMTLVERVEEAASTLPVLLICGDVARYRFRTDRGALRGRRVLLTVSETLAGPASRQVWDYGGIPVSRPMIRLLPLLEDFEWVKDLRQYGWVVLTSPSAVDCLMNVLRRTKTDLRNLPRLFVSGPATAARLEALGLQVAAQPEKISGGEVLLECLRNNLRPGERVLRLRSDRAGSGLADSLKASGWRVDDVVLYRNEPICYECRPRFDMAVFASGSAVESLLAQWGKDALTGKVVAAFPGSAFVALTKAGIPVDVEAPEPVVEACMKELALHEVRRALEGKI